MNRHLLSSVSSLHSPTRFPTRRSYILLLWLPFSLATQALEKPIRRSFGTAKQSALETGLNVPAKVAGIPRPANSTRKSTLKSIKHSIIVSSISVMLAVKAGLKWCGSILTMSLSTMKPWMQWSATSRSGCRTVNLSGLVLECRGWVRMICESRLKLWPWTRTESQSLLRSRSWKLRNFESMLLPSVNLSNRCQLTRRFTIAGCRI